MLDLQKAQEELGAKQEELDIVQAEYENAMREKQVNCPSQKRSFYTCFKEHLMCSFNFTVIPWKGCWWTADKR